VSYEDRLRLLVLGGLLLLLALLLSGMSPVRAVVVTAVTMVLFVPFSDDEVEGTVGATDGLEPRCMTDLVGSTRDCRAGEPFQCGDFCFRPGRVEATATAFLVLRDIPKVRAFCDGVAVELRGGFRGFRGIPAGEHVVLVETYAGALVGARFFVHPGGCIVLRFDHDDEQLVPDVEWGPDYVSKAVRGVMDSCLFDWPAEGPLDR